MYQYIYQYIYIYICVYTYTYNHIYIYTCIYINTDIQVCIYIYRDFAVYIYIYVYVYIHTHLCNDKQCKPGAFGHEFCFVLQYLWRIDGRLSLGQDFMSTTYLWLSFYSFYNKTWRRASTWRHTAALPLVSLRFKQHQSPIIAETRSPPRETTNVYKHVAAVSLLVIHVHMYAHVWSISPRVAATQTVECTYILIQNKGLHQTCNNMIWYPSDHPKHEPTWFILNSCVRVFSPMFWIFAEMRVILRVQVVKHSASSKCSQFKSISVRIQFSFDFCWVHPISNHSLHLPWWLFAFFLRQAFTIHRLFHSRPRNSSRDQWGLHCPQRRTSIKTKTQRNMRNTICSSPMLRS